MDNFRYLNIKKGILITLFLLFPLVAKANEATLRLYDLKVKLKPRVVESRVYWQGREKINWQEEIGNWHFGSLPVDKITSPLEAIQTKELRGATDNIKCVPEDDFLDIIFSTAEPIIFSRDIDIDLEEFPFLNLDAEFKREVDVKLIAFLGVDYTGDGFIDDYLNLEEADEHNLFELAKDKWQEVNPVRNPNREDSGISNGVNEYKDEFKLKRIILLLLPENGEVKENQIGILRFKAIDLYNDNSLILVAREFAPLDSKHLTGFNKDQLRFEDINVKSEVIDQEGIFNLISYFDAAPLEPEGDKSIEEKSTQDKKREFEEVRVFVPLEGGDWKNYPYFSFRYNLDDSQIQDIELAILIEDEGNRKILNLTKNQYKKSEEKIEVNLKEINSEELNIKDLVLRLKRRDDIDCRLPERGGWYQFQLSKLRLYERFPYPIKSKQPKQRFLSLIQTINPRLLKVDENVFGLNDFEGWEDCEDLEREVFSRRIELAKGKHNYERLENPTFDVEWVILEPAHSSSLIAHREEPEITFKKINPTKYLVKVSRAKSPFWLVFSESFHKQWRIYQVKSQKSKVKSLFKNTVANYPNLGVKEAKHLMMFTPQDVKFLFENPFDAPHHLVNGYANGWYIEPDRLGLGEDFTLVIYFWPQSLFYLGLGISGVTLLGCLAYLLYSGLRKK